ncbi:hypothetical protein [Saccharopolyspora spinosa]|uniref:hypothetical protein n=1 Tax=Saccharopolyspora spinosa TaxID=60894 RepID=UPI000497B2B7|nr:hypothetical protein [Saccharopolyspora spinosa]
MWESERVLRAELAVLQAELAKFVPAGITRLAELAERMERHLRTLPPEFDPNGVREYVETMKQRVHQPRVLMCDPCRSFPFAQRSLSKSDIFPNSSSAVNLPAYKTVCSL